MFSRLRTKLRKKLNILKADNKGAAIVVAIVAIAFIGMLVGMLVYMAYYNYLMKHVDKKNKDNFYSAEYALDIINAGLQKDISDSMVDAYVKTMNYSTGMDADTMTVHFKDYYIEYLEGKIGVPGTGNSNKKWLVSHLTDMWEDADLIHAATAGDKGAYLEAIGGDNSLVLTNKDYFTIENVKIVYTNDDGYISMIETDIRLKVPDLDFAQSAAKLNLEEFSLIANNSLINVYGDLDKLPAGISVNKGSYNLNITGSVYGGKNGIQVGNQTNINFVEDTNDNVDVSYKLIAKSINVDNASKATAGVSISEKFSTYVENINVTSSNFIGDGNMYVGDDLDIAGRNSKVVLKGRYRGYGNGNTTSEGSSSILINGANTTLDFSKLEELVLSGHAYVGAKKYDADKDRLAMGSLYYSKTSKGQTLSGNALIDAVNNKVLNSDKIEDEQAFDGQYEDMLGSDEYEIMTSAKELAGDNIIPQNTSDIMMGETISVKANQLLYMVPVECIGYIKGTDEQIVTKNPMTYAEYDMLLNTMDETGKESKYEPVRLAVLWNEMGTSAYTSEYKAVYRRINGTVMVYLYLDFTGEEDMANEFYRAYCKYAPDAVNLYVNSYIKDLKWNRNLTSQLTLAGNMFYLNNNDEVVVIEDSNQNSTKYLNMGLWQEEFTNKHTALMHTLKDNYDAMSSAQLSSDVFDNLVDTTALSNMDGMSFIHNSLPVDSSEISAYVGTKNVLYTSGEQCKCPPGSSLIFTSGGAIVPENTALIITSGDVYVDGDFDGLILSGGNIYIGGNCSKITYNRNKVIKAMKLEYVDTVLNTTTHVYDALGTSGQLSYGVLTAGDGNNAIQLTDLITYQNWKKE